MCYYSSLSSTGLTWNKFIFMHNLGEVLKYDENKDLKSNIFLFRVFSLQGRLEVGLTGLWWVCNGVGVAV